MPERCSARAKHLVSKNTVIMNMLRKPKRTASLPLTSEDMPFDDDTLVFRVANSISCIALSARPTRLLLKCDPELAIDLRERYRAVEPAFHMNKEALEPNLH